MTRRRLGSAGVRRIVATAILSSCALAGVVFAATIDQAVLAKFAQLEKQYKLPESILAKIAMIESGGSTTVRAKTSSAVGMFQWLEKSWLITTNQLYKRPLSLDARTDPFLAAEVTAFSLAETKSQIGGLIAQAKADELVGLYMGHFLGTGGAKKFFTLMIQNPNAPVAPHFATQAAANKGVFYSKGANTSFADVYDHFAKQMRLPGISRVLDYNGTHTGSLQDSRILGSSSRGYLDNPYMGPVPTSDPERDYQTTFSPLPTGSCQQRFYCSSNTVMVRDSACNVSQRETCIYGCVDGICLNPSQQQSCPDGSPPIYGQCRQVQCPMGMQLYNGQCVQMQNYQQQQQYGQLPMSQQPLSSLPTSGAGTAVPATTGGGTGASTAGGSAVPSGSAVTTGGQTGGSPASTAILGGIAATSSGAGENTATQLGTTPAFTSIGDYLLPSTGEVGNTASGFDTSTFDLLSTLDAQAPLTPIGPGPDTVGFGAGGAVTLPTGSTAGIAGQQGSQAPASSRGNGQETFTSADLRDLPVAYGSTADRSPGFIATVLANVKAALLKAYNFLLSLRVRLT